MITIVDYGMGNLGSIRNMLKKIGEPSIITSAKKDIIEADKLILPGVGAFDRGMKNLDDLDLIAVLNDKVLDKQTPLLGICLGMQLLAEKSEEGVRNGLGWIDAEIVKFEFSNNENSLKIPHMGWNTIKFRNRKTLFDKMPDDSRFYFVHSYHIKCAQPDNILTETIYGYSFVSSVQRNNIFGVQFHPEKSHKYGMRILSNFVGI